MGIAPHLFSHCTSAPRHPNMSVAFYLRFPVLFVCSSFVFPFGFKYLARFSLRSLSVFVISYLMFLYFLPSFFGEPLSGASGAGQGPLDDSTCVFRMFSLSFPLAFLMISTGLLHDVLMLLHCCSVTCFAYFLYWFALYLRFPVLFVRSSFVFPF